MAAGRVVGFEHERWGDTDRGDDRYSALTGIAHQVLATSAINASEPEIRRIGGHRSVAFETAPLRRLAVQISDHPSISANLHFGRPIHYHFDSAFAGIRIPAPSDVSPSLKILRMKGTD